jgi:hypothetical protein
MAEPVPFFNPQEGTELWRILEKTKKATENSLSPI